MEANLVSYLTLADSLGRYLEHNPGSTIRDDTLLPAPKRLLVDAILCFQMAPPTAMSKDKISSTVYCALRCLSRHQPNVGPDELDAFIPEVMELIKRRDRDTKQLAKLHSSEKQKRNAGRYDALSQVAESELNYYMRLAGIASELVS